MSVTCGDLEPDDGDHRNDRGQFGNYGAHVAAAAPSGTVTFLFSDIQDSTRLWDESPVDMAAAVQIHDSILRNVIDRHEGYLFATDGDGFGAAFTTPASACRFACRSDSSASFMP